MYIDKAWHRRVNRFIGTMVQSHKSRNAGVIKPKFARQLATKLEGWVNALRVAADKYEKSNPETSTRKVIDPISVKKVLELAGLDLSERKIQVQCPELSIRQIKKILGRKVS